MIKRLLIALTASLACLAATGHAQISFTAAGTGVKTFDTAPTIADGWSTLTVGTAATTYTTSNGLYTAVQNVAASTVNTVLGTSTTVPPSANAIARHNGTLFRLQTR